MTRTTRTRRAAFKATAAASGLAAFALVIGSTSAAPAAASVHQVSSTPGGHVKVEARSVTLRDTSDSYVATAWPNMRPGADTRLVATNNRHNRKIAYLKFRVRGLHRGVHVKSATLTLTRDLHHMPTSVVRLYRVRSSTWGQSGLDAKHRPRLHRHLATARVNRSMDSVALTFRHVIKTNGTYAFAITDSARTDVVRFNSRESGSPPLLTLHYTIPVLVLGNQPTPSPTPTPTGPTPTPDPNCTLSSMLVPSCGVLFGGVLTSFGGTDVMSNYDDFTAGTGLKNLALVHDYRRPGQVLSPYDIKVVQNAGTILQLNWKPASNWADAGGGNSTVNAQIDQMAASIKSMAPHKMFLTIWHEPENDVSGGASGCPSTIYKGSAGTPAQYRAMWANVESRFAADGVTNVVWDMNYMGYAAWDCMIDDLWPGNSLVDWVMFESYASQNSTFASITGHTYNLLTSLSDASHDYLSKPWGIGEFGTNATSDSVQETYYTGIKQALDSGEFPKLKLLSVFDSPGVGGDYRVAYDAAGNSDPKELSDFMSLADDPAITDGDQAAANSLG